MIHCFTRNCTKKNEKIEEELGMLEEIKIIRSDPGVRSLAVKLEKRVYDIFDHLDETSFKKLPK